MFTVTNSIIAGSTSTGTAPNVSGTFVTQGSNVVGDAAGATGFTDGANGDQVGVADPKVGVLGNHGGLTDTLPLLAGSVAINQANAPPRRSAISAAMCVQMPLTWARLNSAARSQ